MANSSIRFDPRTPHRQMMEASRKADAARAEADDVLREYLSTPITADGASQLKPGAKVRVKHHHPEAKDGQHGEVREVHVGVYYGIGFGDGPLAYVPADHCEPVQSGDAGSTAEGGTTSAPSGSGGGTGAGAGAGASPAAGPVAS